MTNHHTPSGRPLVRRAAAFAVAAVALAAPAVAGTTLPAHAADAAPAVKVAIATDIDTFNPFLAILASSTGIHHHNDQPFRPTEVSEIPV